MPRAKLPHPDDLKRGLEAQAWWNPNRVIVAIQAEWRLYDRLSGNFKASGWAVTVQYRLQAGAVGVLDEIIYLRDAQIQPMVQTRLD